MKILFACIPLAILLEHLHLNPLLIFLTAALSVIPLAKVMGDATEYLSKRFDHELSGLINASLGTIPDIIIGGFALKNGLIEVVKASITGAIIGNLLFGLGIAITLGGLKSHKAMHFDTRSVHLQGGLLLLAVTGLIIPAIFDFSTVSEEEISEEVAVVLLITYLLSVLHTLTERRSANRDPVPSLVVAEVMTRSGMTKHVLQLVFAGLALAGVSEILTTAMEPATNLLHLTPIFAGIFLLAPVGNAVECINATRFARQDQLNITLAATLGASTQMALLAAPILVFMSMGLGQSMNLVFSKFQVVSIILSVALVNNILTLGSVRWISGAKLLATYVILAIGFYAAP